MKRTTGLVILALLLGGAAAAQTAAPPQMPLFPQQTPEEKALSDAHQAAYAKMPDTQGTGAYPALKEEDPGLPGHVVYRPADLAKLGKGRLGLVGWGNGACSKDGAGSRLYLAEIASHGYVVVAPGGIHSGPGAIPLPPPPPGPPQFVMATSAADVKAGIEWALAENARPASPYYGKIDPAKLAVAGFSCGGAQALELAGDPRVKWVIMQSSGMFPDGVTVIPGLTVNKATLRTLHTPVLYILGGPKDIAYTNGMDDFARIDHVPVAVVSNSAGHGGDFLKSNGGPSAQAAVAWLEWQLRGDKTARATFVGEACGICTDKQWTLQRKNLPTR
jgi:dienelactone hydrolase